MHDLRNKHDETFLRLFAESESALRSFVRSLLPARADASETMQQVTVVLWQKFTEFDPTRDFRRWAFGVARLEALKFRRDRARDRHVFDDELVAKLADESVASSARQLTQREALEACLQKLPSPQRKVVLAAYARGVRIDELAAYRGQTAMSLYKLLQRIRRTLLECVQHAIAREEIT